MIKTGVLSNGIRIVTESILNAQTVSVQCTVEIGSQNDPPAYCGLAHLLEHALFLGTRSFSQEEIQKYDYATGGNLNAETNQEHTVISTEVLPEDFPSALTLIADMIQNPLFPPQAVQREKKVVLNEIEEVSQDDDMFADNLLYMAAFKGQAMQHPTEGYEETVQAITADVLKQHARLYTQPDKIIISISGNVRYGAVKNLCQKLFGHMQMQPATDLSKPVIYVGGDKRQAEDMTSNVFRLGFNGIPHRDYHNDVKADLLATVLENTLYDELRHKRGLIYGIHADNIAYKKCAVFTIGSSCFPKNTKEVIQRCAQIIGQIEKYITPQSLLTAQKSVKINLCSAGCSPSERASSNEFDLRCFNRVIPVSEYFQLIDAVTVYDIQETAEQIFSSRLSFAGVGKIKEMPSYKQITDWIEKSASLPKEHIAKQTIQNHLSTGRERC